jgi:branched-chain amino acid aminotransferase
MAECINVNGRITAPEEASVSPLDRGFLYGDSVYETIRTYGGRPFLLREHLERLRRSAGRLAIPHERIPIDLAAGIEETLARAGNGESAIRVILSRGVGGIGYDADECGPPTVVIHVRPCPEIPASWRREGVDVAIVDVTRNPSSAVDPAIKSSNLLNNLLAWQAARRLRVFEPILPNARGHLTEGATSNLFLVRDSRLATPALESGLLRGITRDLVLDLARSEGIPTSEEELAPEALREADEAFLTSTLKGILPIRRCDGWPIREGRPGPLTRCLMDLFEARVQAETKAGSAPGSILR